MDMNLGKLLETQRGQEAWRAAVHLVTKSRTRQSDNRTEQGAYLNKIKWS